MIDRNKKRKAPGLGRRYLPYLVVEQTSVKWFDERVKRGRVWRGFFDSSKERDTV